MAFPDFIRAAQKVSDFLIKSRKTPKIFESAREKEGDMEERSNAKDRETAINPNISF